jgi:hypothetical protein
MCCCQNTPSQYNLLCIFNVHKITVTHNVLLSEHTVTDRHNTICYVRSVCTTHNMLLSEHTVTHRHSTICYVRSLYKMCCFQNTYLQTVRMKFVMYFQCAQHNKCCCKNTLVTDGHNTIFSAQYTYYLNTDTVVWICFFSLCISVCRCVLSHCDGLPDSLVFSSSILEHWASSCRKIYIYGYIYGNAYIFSIPNSSALQFTAVPHNQIPLIISNNTIALRNNSTLSDLSQVQPLKSGNTAVTKLCAANWSCAIGRVEIGCSHGMKGNVLNSNIC